jgi:transcription termination factor Rho
VTDTQEQVSSAPAETTAAPRAKRGSLSTMLVPELQQVASGLGLSTAKLKKSDLIAAIQAAQSGASSAGSSSAASPAPAGDAPARARRAPRAPRGPRADREPRVDRAPSDTVQSDDREDPAPRDSVHSDDREDRQSRDSVHSDDREDRELRDSVRSDNREDRELRDTAQRDDRGPREDREPRQNNDRQGNQNRQNNDRQNNQNRQGNSSGNQGGNQGNRQAGNQGNNQNRQNSANQGNRQGGNQGNNQGNQGGNGQFDEDDDFDRPRGRRYRDRRGRNRERTGGGPMANSDVEPTVFEDDVLIPVAGILDAIEDKNSWFVRTGGYYASNEDVYVANSYVRRFGLRRGDAVTGAIRQQREGERKEKYNPLVRLDTVNGQDPEQAKNRVEFTKLTPLYPQERLRLETEPHILTTRVIDLVMPIGKGQRALIVSPPKAGKTMVLQAIANAIATNNPEVHLMVVLIDERPEEVTDMQRSVKGEVIASTFDRRPQDHITVAELSIERAKRLVEMGHDVVVLLDSITRLGRAYNLGAPASGRILSGGVDSTALYPPKRFLGAARNIEHGGSLTILATALVETGSAGDTVIFEEFKGTGNAELKLDRKIADKRIFPAVDVDQSSTRKEEILLSPDELAVTIKLRRVLHELESQQAINLLLDRLKKSRTNIEFLMQIAKTTPGE